MTVLKRAWKRTILLGLLCTSVAWGSNRVNDVRVSHQFDKTRIVIGMQEPVKYHLFHLKKPHRLVIDLPHTQMHASLTQALYYDTPIREIRTARHDDGSLRIVFDLKGNSKAHVFMLRPMDKHRYRLVVDLSYHPKYHIVKSQPHVAVVEPSVNIKPKPKIVIPRRRTWRDIVVVIDPGHGGKDPGATGARRSHEKNIVLAIGRELKTLINRQPGMRAVLTRKGDYYIPLRGRLGIARKDKADLFISIHADAFKKRSSHGVSVFALSQRGASSEAARWLAARENYSELGGLDLNDLYDRSAVVRSVLLDLSQTATISASLRFGSKVLKQLSHFAKLHNDKIEQARFVVLKSPDIPSVLIETGFISNPREERLLNSRSYRHKLTLAILSGIKSYFWSEPPLGSYIYAWRNAKSVRVAKRESLNQFADRYDIPTHELKRFNKLSSTHLKVGQLIRIPKEV